jgi:hypothetical protein
MRRHLVTAAVVLGIVQTATHALSLASAVAFTIRTAAGAEPGPLTVWRLQVVLSAAASTAWVALVSYAAVQVCRDLRSHASRPALRAGSAGPFTGDHDES